MLQDTIQRLRNIFHDKVQKQLIPGGCREEAVLQTDDIGVFHGAHQLQLPVLVTSILQHLLDGKGLPSLQTLSLHVKSNSIPIASTNLQHLKGTEISETKMAYLEDNPK